MIRDVIVIKNDIIVLDSIDFIQFCHHQILLF